MYDVVADVDRYPEYLSGWEQVTTEKLSDDAVRVRQHVSFGPIDEWFVTIARFDRPHRISVEPASNPSNLAISLGWQFIPGGECSCQVELQMRASAANFLVEKLLGKMIPLTGHRLVQQFTHRVETVYHVSCRAL